MCQRKKYTLAAGPRFCGKTIGALAAFVEHAWNTPRANNCIITISQTVGLDSGVWKDLVEVVIPDWIEGDFGMEWYKEPYIMGVSKKPTCEIVNKFGVDMDPKERKRHGGTSVIQLESLKVEDEVEARFKPRRYSGIYVPELTTFKNRHTFDTWSECLRLMGLAPDKHLFLADTNPDDPGHWVYHVWFELLNLDPDEVPEEERALYDQLGRVDFDLADNIFDPQQRIDELKARYWHDQDLYSRYIDGKWTTATEDALFYKVFSAQRHVVGEISSPANKEPEIMVPEEGCFELFTGSDLGVTNSAAVVAEKVYRDETVDANGKSVVKRVPCLKFLDELVRTGEVFSMDEFVMEWVQLLDFWEQILQKPGRIRWTHWSDRSAFDFRETVSNRYHHQIVYDASNGRIILQAADRGPGSIAQRVDLWRKLLFEDRLWFSADRCPKLILMNKSIKRGTSKMQVIAAHSLHKHIFDAASYMAASEFGDELQRQVVRDFIAQRRMNNTESQVVAVSL